MVVYFHITTTIDCKTRRTESRQTMTEDVRHDGPLGGGRAPAPGFDPERYRHHLEGLAITPEQEAEFLAALWSVMTAFVDLGFGVDSVQRLFPAMIENAGAGTEDDSQ
jgi:hypothetical protein